MWTCHSQPGWFFPYHHKSSCTENKIPDHKDSRLYCNRWRRLGTTSLAHIGYGTKGCSCLNFRHWLKIRTYSNLRKRSRDENWSSLLLHWLHSILEKLIRNRNDSFNTFTSGTSDWDVFTCSDDQTGNAFSSRPSDSATAATALYPRIQKAKTLEMSLGLNNDQADNVHGLNDELKDKLVISKLRPRMGPKG